MFSLTDRENKCITNYRDLNVVLVNVRSLKTVNKLAELEILENSTKCDVLSVNLTIVKHG